MLLRMTLLARAILELFPNSLREPEVPETCSNRDEGIFEALLVVAVGRDENLIALDATNGVFDGNS